jgi:cytochrome c biogenesis protein
MSAVLPPSPPPVAPSRPPSRPWLGDVLDLLASMRFSISLLTVICITSSIGTVIKQGEPLVNYVDQFGPFWAEVFGALGLYRVYSTPWFLLILAFLVVSTSLCVVRNTPRILADWRTHKEHIRAQSLNAFHHHAQGNLDAPVAEVQARVEQVLGQQGWSIKKQVRTGTAVESGVMIGARLGAANKLGYIAAHSAIVLICLGGLFDGDLLIKVQAWAQHLQPFKGSVEPDKGRLSEGNPAYRAQLFVPEGQRSDAAVVNLEQGMLVQPLPFEVELKKFKVEYYATGMPKRFASDIVIHDPVSKVAKPFTVEVNHPVVYDGVTIFQSSFEDGGSLVRLRPLGLSAKGAVGESPDAVINTAVNGAAVNLPARWWAAFGGAGPGDMRLEVTGLRLINVEDLAQAQGQGESGEPTDVRGVNPSALGSLEKHLGSGAKAPGEKKLVNIGPSVSYKLRDAAGQAREYQNFMAPVQLDGQSVFLLGVRDTPADGFKYLRVPADQDLSVKGWLRLRQALSDGPSRDEAAKRFGRMAAPADRKDLQEQLFTSAQRALDLCAGAVPATAGAPAGGLQALSRFIEQVVPEPERERTSATLIRILNGAVFELLNLSRERAGQSPLKPDDEAVRVFMTQAVLSLSDAMFYPVPVVFALEGFEQKQASVFQVTRTPGRNVVYLGCVLLIIGVFAMLYIRERRLWVWMQAAPEGGSTLRLALSSTRQTLDTDREFDRLRQTLLGPDAPLPTPSSVA